MSCLIVQLLWLYHGGCGLVNSTVSSQRDTPQITGFQMTIWRVTWVPPMATRGYCWYVACYCSNLHGKSFETWGNPWKSSSSSWPETMISSLLRRSCVPPELPHTTVLQCSTDAQWATQGHSGINLQRWSKMAQKMLRLVSQWIIFDEGLTMLMIYTLWWSNGWWLFNYAEWAIER